MTYRNLGDELYHLREQVATDATRLQSLEAENARLRNCIGRVKDFANAGKPHAYIVAECRNALKED